MLRSGCRNSFSRSPDASGFTAPRSWPAAVSAKTKTQLTYETAPSAVLVRRSVPLLLGWQNLGVFERGNGTASMATYVVKPSQTKRTIISQKSDP